MLIRRNRGSSWEVGRRGAFQNLGSQLGRWFRRTQGAGRRRAGGLPGPLHKPPCHQGVGALLPHKRGQGAGRAHGCLSGAWPGSPGVSTGSTGEAVRGHRRGETAFVREVCLVQKATLSSPLGLWSPTQDGGQGDEGGPSVGLGWASCHSRPPGAERLVGGALPRQGPRSTCRSFLPPRSAAAVGRPPVACAAPAAPASAPPPAPASSTCSSTSWPVPAAASCCPTPWPGSSRRM